MALIYEKNLKKALAIENLHPSSAENAKSMDLTIRSIKNKKQKLKAAELFNLDLIDFLKEAKGIGKLSQAIH